MMKIEQIRELISEFVGEIVVNMPDVKLKNTAEIRFQYGSKIADKIIITDEQDFDIIYNTENERFEIYTTWSNQELSMNFLIKLKNLMEIIDEVNGR